MLSIPKIIHQIWWQGISQLPDKYRDYKDSWKIKHPNWIIIYWDENKVINLVKKYYPNILKLLSEYQYMIQKIDVAKYLILYHYGGVYVDMDTICEQSLNNLFNKKEFMNYNFICSQMEIIPFIKIINNGIIFSMKKHPLLEVLISQLKKYQEQRYYHNQDYYIMESTGPIFFHHIISEYKNSNVLILPENYLESCTMLDYPKCDKKGNYITHHHTLSWSTSYFRYIFIIGTNIKKYRLIIIILIILLIIRYKN